MTLATLLASVLLFIVAPTPAESQVVTLACSVVDDGDGFQVVWTAPTAGRANEAIDRIVIERNVDGTWWWRGRAAPGDLGFADGAAPAGADEVRYRVIAKEGEVVVHTTPCLPRTLTVTFSCSVTVSGAGYQVSWDEALAADHAGAAVDYVIERDVNPEDIYHWRGRTDSLSFDDGGARVPPDYRVTARVNRVPIGSADCDATGPLAGLREGAAIVCPVPGASFVNTFGADRDGGARRHKGVDMFAPRHSPVLAPEAGRVRFYWNRVGGTSFALVGDSGTFYYGTHLEDEVGEDRMVSAGELIATVGNSGNARTTPTHLHFQIHPGGRGSAAVDPTAAAARACR